MLINKNLKELLMAAKKLKLSDYDTDIAKLLKEIEKKKNEKKEYEGKLKSEIGNLYYELLNLEENINLEELRDKLKNQLKQKKAFIKEQKNNNQN